jgi:hypothetical protein
MAHKIVRFFGGAWDGQRRPVTADNAGRLQDHVRDVDGRAVYKLVYDHAATGEAGWTYAGPRYEYLPDGERSGLE